MRVLAPPALINTVIVEFTGFCQPSEDRHAHMARLFFPEVITFTISLDGAEALVNIARARRLIGFDPEYTVQQ